MSTPGEFRLKFVLYELSDGEANCLGEAISSPFTVYEGTASLQTIKQSELTTSFMNQGIRLSKRKLKPKRRYKALSARSTESINDPLNTAFYGEERGALRYGPLASNVPAGSVFAREPSGEEIQALKEGIQWLQDELDRLKSRNGSLEERVRKLEGHGRFRETG